MAEFEHSHEENEPRKPKKDAQFLISVSLIGILVVLIVSNLSALLAPFSRLSSVLAPITIGLVIAYISNPFLRFFESKLFDKLKRRTVTRGVAMLFTYLLLLLIIAGIMWLIVPQAVAGVRDLSNNGISYVNRFINSINQLLSSLPAFIWQGDATELLSLEKILTYTLDWLGTYGSQIATNVGSIASGTVTALKNILVGLFISVYVLLSKERLGAGCRRIFRALLAEDKEKKLCHYISKAHTKFGGFIVGKLLDSLAVGVICGILFSIFQIPYAVLIAVIIGVTDFIPFFGPFIGAIPSTLIIFIISPSKALLFVFLILVVQQIDGNLVAPVILGDRTGLSSLGVIVAITVMSGLFGITGMIIGVPLFALIMTILDDFLVQRLVAKGAPVGLHEYYAADAFIRPLDIKTDHETMTQRFIHWVKSVEDEPAEPAEAVTRRKRASRNVRLSFLAIGSTLHRIFSVKPIPEDRSGGIFEEIAKHGIRTNRSIFRAVFLSIITLFIYPFYLVEVIAQSTNLACRDDGKRSWGCVPMLFFGIITLGVYPVIWHCQMIRRFTDYCNNHGETCPVTVKFYLLWSLVGLLSLVGPLIALSRFLKAFNKVGTIYNSTHTFPLSAAERGR